MARTKAASFDAQRGAIRDAAARLFADKGYASASIADIAAACGVSKALLYHYYRDKEHLLHDIAESYVERLQAIVEEVQARGAAAGRAPAAADRALHDGVRTLGGAPSRAGAGREVPVARASHPRRRAPARAWSPASPRRSAQLAPAAAPRDWRRPLTMILFGMMNWTFTWLQRPAAR